MGKIITILSFPVLLLIGIVLIPVVSDYSNHQLAEQAVQQTTRWFLGHILAAVAFAISINTIRSINKHLQLVSQSLPSITFPLITVGAGLYAAGLGADGIGPLAVQAAGYSPTIFFDGSGWWVTGIFLVGTIVYGLGLLSMVIHMNRQRFLTGWSSYISFVSVLIFMTAPMILSGWALYGVALAAFGIFLPVVLLLWQDS